MFSSRKSKIGLGSIASVAIIAVASVMYSKTIKEWLAKVPVIGEFVEKNAEQ